LGIEFYAPCNNAELNVVYRYASRNNEDEWVLPTTDLPLTQRLVRMKIQCRGVADFSAVAEIWNTPS
jgi:hypothetical protein